LKIIRMTALLCFPLLAATAAQAADAPDVQKALVGHWISASRQIVDFEADKTFRMYPKCGVEAAEWKKRDMDYLPATWTIVDGNHMQLTLSAHGETKVIDATVAVSGNEMRMTDSSGHAEAHQRYTGAWPPVCPAKP
jgi:hypothetical protein